MLQEPPYTAAAAVGSASNAATGWRCNRRRQISKYGAASAPSSARISMGTSQPSPGVSWVAETGCKGERGCRGEENSYLEGEGVGMLAQLLNQPLLQARQGLLLLRDRGEGLDVGHEKVLAEGQSQHVQVLPAIAEGTGQRHKDWGGEKAGQGDPQSWYPGAVCRQAADTEEVSAERQRWLKGRVINPMPSEVVD